MLPPILSKPSKAALLAISFVTIGALVMVNTAIWYLYHSNNQPVPAPGEPHSDSFSYWCASFFFSGLTLFVIGFALGRIGRSARRAELPPEVSSQPTAQPAVTAAPVAQPLAANGQAVMPGQVAIPGQPVAVPPVAGVAPIAPLQ